MKSTIDAGAFKGTWLKGLIDVALTRRPLVIKKRKMLVAKLFAYTDGGRHFGATLMKADDDLHNQLEQA